MFTFGVPAIILLTIKGPKCGGKGDRMERITIMDEMCIRDRAQLGLSAEQLGLKAGMLAGAFFSLLLLAGLALSIRGEKRQSAPQK